MKDKPETSLPATITEGIRQGTSLAGDDFSESELAVWFEQEQEAFFEDDSGNSEEDPWYAYMRQVNEVLGFSALRAAAIKPSSALVLGPGSGAEIESFASENPDCKIFFVEASANFQALLKEKFTGAEVLQPSHLGAIDLPTGSQDLVCAFSVLHHIPNVSYVLEELGRITKPGGLLMVREPCSSMGDWRSARSATPNERGISRDLMISFAEHAGLELVRRPTAIILEPINKLLKKINILGQVPFGVIYCLDRVLSWMLSFNDHYWRDSFLKKIGPSSYFFLFRKRSHVIDRGIENKSPDS